MACTSPAATVRLTSELATTPGNRLVIPVSWTAGAPRSGTASAGASAVLMGGRIPYLVKTRQGSEGKSLRAPARRQLLLRLVRNGDRARDDLGLVALEDVL